MSLQEPISISSLKSQRKMKNSQDHLYTDKHPTKHSHILPANGNTAWSMLLVSCFIVNDRLDRLFITVGLQSIHPSIPVDSLLLSEGHLRALVS